MLGLMPTARVERAVGNSPMKAAIMEMLSGCRSPAMFPASIAKCVRDRGADHRPQVHILASLAPAAALLDQQETTHAKR
jgi:hypothetical protein